MTQLTSSLAPRLTISNTTTGAAITLAPSTGSRIIDCEAEAILDGSSPRGIDLTSEWVSGDFLILLPGSNTLLVSAVDTIISSAAFSYFPRYR